MGKYSKAFSIKKQFQSPNCQTCQGQSRTMKKIIFLELFLRIIEDEKWNLFEKLGQLRTPTEQHEEEARGKGDLGQVAEVDRVSQPDEGAQRLREEINLSNKNAANRF